MFLRVKKASGYEYLQIVENKWANGKSLQRVIGTIGRMDELAGGVKTLKVLTKRLRERFGIERICVVSDRGMISKKTIAEFESEGIHYILGVRMRQCLEITSEVLEDGAWDVIYGPRQSQKDPIPLLVKETRVQGRRYIVCENPEETKADAEIRAQIVSALKK